MRHFFYPDKVAVFGVGDGHRNLAKNIISNSREMGFKGEIFPVGRKPGQVFGAEIITDPESLPVGIDLGVILVPARFVPETLDICGRKGITHAIISTGGFREFDQDNLQLERDVIQVASRYGIQFIGPNCIGVICTGSNICTPFNPFQPKVFKKGPVSIIVQSGGITTQCAYSFSEAHVGFSKIISVGNKLNLNEIDFLKYLIDDKETEQIHMYLESIEDGRELMRIACRAKKPIVIFKSNVGEGASEIAKSHTAALSNNDTIVEGALRQAGIVRARDIHDMTVCAKALQLYPLKGENLAAMSLSGGAAVILGDACEKYGFKCPPFPDSLLERIQSLRRGGVIRMSNPMDLGDVHNIESLAFILENCLALDYIQGLVLSFMYGPELTALFSNGVNNPRPLLNFMKGMCDKYKKPISLSFLGVGETIEGMKNTNLFPVFDSPDESVRALRILRNYWRNRDIQEAAT